MREYNLTLTLCSSQQRCGWDVGEYGQRGEVLGAENDCTLAWARVWPAETMQWEVLSAEEACGLGEQWAEEFEQVSSEVEALASWDCVCLECEGRGCYEMGL